MRSYVASNRDTILGYAIALAILAIVLAFLGTTGALLAIAPIIVRKPVLTLTQLVAGVPTGSPVDVSDDVSSVELSPDIPTDDVETFSGNYQQAGEPTWSAQATIVVNADTSANWTPLVGSQVRAKLYDIGSDTTRYRQFDSEVLIDPALGGSTEPGSARSFDMPLPVLSAPTWVEP